MISQRVIAHVKSFPVPVHSHGKLAAEQIGEFSEDQSWNRYKESFMGNPLAND